MGKINTIAFTDKLYGIIILNNLNNLNNVRINHNFLLGRHFNFGHRFFHESSYTIEIDLGIYNGFLYINAYDQIRFFMVSDIREFFSMEEIHCMNFVDFSEEKFISLINQCKEIISKSKIIKRNNKNNN